jgi:hypothetical protein
MPDDYELLPDAALRDLADSCGRGCWRADRPIPATTYFVQRSRVENFLVVARLIRDRSDVLDDERTRNAVWVSVCHAVDFHLQEPGTGAEKRRTLAAIEIAGRADAEHQFIRFVNHRMNGGATSWAEWMALGGQGG